MKKIIFPLSLLVALVAGIAVGYVLGAKGKLPAVSSFCQNSTAQEVKDKLLKTGTINEYATSLSGQVLSVQGKEVSFEAPLVNPLQDEKLKTRVAIITDQTKITVFARRTQEEREKLANDWAQEIKELQEKLAVIDKDIKSCLDPKEGSSSVCLEKGKDRQAIQDNIYQLQSLSSEYSKTEGNISNIKPGYFITATAKVADGTASVDERMKPGVNIANELKFEVSAVEVREMTKRDVSPAVPVK